MWLKYSHDIVSRDLRLYVSVELAEKSSKSGFSEKSKYWMILWNQIQAYTLSADYWIITALSGTTLDSWNNKIFFHSSSGAKRKCVGAINPACPVCNGADWMGRGKWNVVLQAGTNFWKMIHSPRWQVTNYFPQVDISKINVKKKKKILKFWQLCTLTSDICSQLSALPTSRY